MSYSESDSIVLKTQRIKLASDLHNALLETLKQADAQTDARVQEYLRFGVGRRLNNIELLTRRIFVLFPPEQEKPLPAEITREVAIFLQSFISHLSGIFDNFAWAFVLRHGLFEVIGGKNNLVGIFLRETQRCFPPELRSYVLSTMTPWHNHYLKMFRDGTAHRIPLYVPPYTMNPVDHDTYRGMEEMKAELLRSGDLENYDRIDDQQDELGRALPVFLDDFSRWVPFHPQLNADTALVTEFSNVFYRTWHEYTQPSNDDPPDVAPSRAI